MGAPLPRPASLNPRLDLPIEEWPYLDEVLLKTRSRKVCMTCHWFRHDAGVNCIPVLTCTRGTSQGSVELQPGLAKSFEQLGHIGACLKAISRQPVGGVVPAGVKSWRRHCGSANPDEVAKTPDPTKNAALFSFFRVSNPVLRLHINQVPVAGYSP